MACPESVASMATLRSSSEVKCDGGRCIVIRMLGGGGGIREDSKKRRPTKPAVGAHRAGDTGAGACDYHRWQNVNMVAEIFSMD